jgi:uncharacterized protein
VRILVLADTHLKEGQVDRLTDLLGARLETADAILHAGDVIDAAVLDGLSRFAPVHAVLGNNDRGLALPDRLDLEIGSCHVAMVHDSGPSSGRQRRLRRWFPHADVVVFGHSHLPWHETDVRIDDGHVQHHFNPGSAIQRRSAPQRTIGWLVLDPGRIAGLTHEPLD